MCKLWFNFTHTALTDDNGTSILNGNSVISQYARTFAYGGVTFDYSGTNATLERVNTSFARKLTRKLTIQVRSGISRFLFTITISQLSFQILSRTDNYMYPELLSYSYNIEKPSAPQQPTFTYSWRMSTWGQCNKLCSGTHYRTAECIRSDDQPVPEANCSKFTKPRNESEDCNTDCHIL